MVLAAFLVSVCPLLRAPGKLTLILEWKLVVWVTNPNLDFLKTTSWKAAWGIIMYYKQHGDAV